MKLIVGNLYTLEGREYKFIGYNEATGQPEFMLVAATPAARLDAVMEALLAARSALDNTNNMGKREKAFEAIATALTAPVAGADASPSATQKDKL